MTWVLVLLWVQGVVFLIGAGYEAGNGGRLANFVSSLLIGAANIWAAVYLVSLP